MNTFFAVIIIIAITITMAIAAATWVITTFHSMQWKPEILRILDVKIHENMSDDSWWLYIQTENIGETKAEIYKVEIHGIEIKSLNPPKTINPGERKEIHIKLDKEYVHSTMYTLRLYLKSGTVYPILEKIVRIS